VAGQPDRAGHRAGVTPVVSAPFVAFAVILGGVTHAHPEVAVPEELQWALAEAGKEAVAVLSLAFGEDRP